MIETLKSTEVLTKEGFKVMVYCNDDPLNGKKIRECWGMRNHAFSSTNRLWSWNTKYNKYKNYKKSDKTYH